MALRDSKNLGEYFDRRKIDPELKQELDNLAWIWMDPDLVKRFKEQIASLIERDPEIIPTAKAEVQKAAIVFWIESNKAKVRVNKIFDLAGDNNLDRVKRGDQTPLMNMNASNDNSSDSTKFG
jgi:hypothetical protein